MTRVEAAGAEELRKRYLTVILILAVALVLAAVALGLMLEAKGGADDRARAAEDQVDGLVAAESAARELLLDMTTYQYTDLDEVYDWVDRLADDELRDRMTANEDTFKKIVRLSKASAEGEVVDSAYRTNEDGSVTVIAFVRQEIRDAESEQPKLDEKWATLVLEDRSGEWLVSDVQLSNIPQGSGAG